MEKPSKILVVDDEPVGRQLLEAILYPAGYNVIFAEDGFKALNSIQEESPDIVLLDVMMPKMDGFEVCKKVRSQADIAHTPIFLITALDDRDSKIKGIDAGADDYISKPFNRVEILAKIKNRTALLQRRQQHILEEEQRIDIVRETFDENLINCLTDLTLQASQQIIKNDVDIFCSTPVNKSQHAFIISESETGTFYALISNKPDVKDCILLNCITASLMMSFASDIANTPATILKKILAIIQEMSVKYNNSKLQNSPDSIIIFFKDKIHKRFIAAGTNQYIFFENEVVSKTSESEEKSFQSLILTSDKDLTITNSKKAFIFSPNVFDTIGQPQLISFLNTYHHVNFKHDILPILPGRFDEKSDIIVVKIII